MWSLYHFAERIGLYVPNVHDHSRAIIIAILFHPRSLAVIHVQEGVNVADISGLLGHSLADRRRFSLIWVVVPEDLVDLIAIDIAHAAFIVAEYGVEGARLGLSVEVGNSEGIGNGRNLAHLPREGVKLKVKV